MAKIGDIWLGGKEPEAPNSEHFPSGIAFFLLVKGKSKIDYIWESQDSQWQVELKQNHAFAVARSRNPQAYKNLVDSGLEQIQCCLDIIAAKKLGILVLDHPEKDHIALFQRNEETVLRHFSNVRLGVETSVSVEVRDKEGNIKPSDPIPEPIWTPAFRYYRLSQASQDIFEAYRRLFLALEALLGIIRPKLKGEKEREWLEDAFSKVVTRPQVAKSILATIKDPIKYFMEKQYTNIRCRLFHAKPTYDLLPQKELNPADVQIAYKELLQIWRAIAIEYFQVPVGGSVITYVGFKWWMDKLFRGPLSLHFTEDSSPPQADDTQVSPLGLTTFEFEQPTYLSETKPGVVSWQGEISLLDIHKHLSIHRVSSLVNKRLFNTAFIPDGLSPSGADIFQTYQSIFLVNLSQPKMTF